jgi:GNAT superfamily N-acetyltransferase
MQERLSRLTKIIYGFGDSGFSLTSTIVGAYFAIFIGRSWDYINDLVPSEYWGSGVAILLFDEMLRRARARGYRWIDLSLTSDDNPRTPALATRFGAQLYKRYRVYRMKI